MTELNTDALIQDLAFILILGAGVTLLFKWIKQPVVLGYIVAGFLASPNFSPLPSVAEEANIEFWAQIGIVVLLFSLGLEFSFKKLVNTGGSAVVTALIIVIGMMSTGVIIGKLMHFSTINCLFLGGMLSMSSTTIIIKALTDLGMKQRKFASMVFAVLVVEDMFAVVMMVILSSIAVNNSVEGSEMLMSISKLVFFLVIWFLVGVFVLPSTLNRTRRFLNNETLLVVSMGLCLGMAIFSVACGFSLALGAFVMGSILAGTSYAERIERVTMPVKDLFGAVFFISVGMMVEPAIIQQYWGPILILSVAVIIGMLVFGTFGMLVTGQTLKVAMESGFSLTQIGEFAFIIASLGMSLGVLDPTIYPIVVAVSVITTFTTPYFIKMADPSYRFVEKHLPARLHFLIDRYSEDANKASDKQGVWKSFLGRYLWRMMIYSIILVAITIVATHFFIPWLKDILPGWYRIVGSLVTLTVMAPFLLALALPASRKPNQQKLPENYRVPRVVLMVFRLLLVLGFIIHVLTSICSMAVGIPAGIIAAALIIFIFSRQLSSRLQRIESRFINNLNERELRRSGKNNSVVSDLHLAYIQVGYKCPFVGERLKDSGLRSDYGVSVAYISRGSGVIPVPQGNDRIFPGDVLGIIGTDEQIQRLLPVMESDEGEGETTADIADYKLTNIELSEKSALLGRTLQSANIGSVYESLVIAVERDGAFVEPLNQVKFSKGDKVYLVGPSARISEMK